jgi:peptide/nickel transport system substrate-binding protein
MTHADSADLETLVIARSSDSSRLDPHTSTSPADVSVVFNLFDTLVNRRGGSGENRHKLAPSLATSWRRLGDLSWEFELRQGVRFHNGDEFTSKDVKFTIERTFDPNTKPIHPAITKVFTTVERVEAPSPHTVRIVTKSPDFLLPDRLAFFGGPMLPKEHYTKVGPEAFEAHPIGTGALRFSEWKKDSRTLVTERNPDYWGDRVPFERVIWKGIHDPDETLEGFEKGEIDLIVRLHPDHVEAIRKSTRGRFLSVPYGGNYSSPFLTSRPPFDNKFVRLGFAWATDRDFILNNVYKGFGKPLKGAILPGQLGFDPDLESPGFDQTKAREFLAKGGYRGEEITLETGHYMTKEIELGRALVRMWRAVGINVREEYMEHQVRTRRTIEMAHKDMLMGDTTDTLGDPDGKMWRMLQPGAALSFMRDKEFDRLGEEAHFSSDQTLRERNFRRMNQIFAERTPWITYMQPDELFAASNRILWTPYSDTRVELRGFNLMRSIGT